MKENSIFDNTEIAFTLKSDSELERAYFLFKMISIEPLVKIGTSATKFALNMHLPIWACKHFLTMSFKSKMSAQGAAFFCHVWFQCSFLRT